MRMILWAQIHDSCMPVCFEPFHQSKNKSSSYYPLISKVNEMKLLMESTENSEKSEPQMGSEPTTLPCIRMLRIDHGGSWVQIPSGARIFPSSQWIPSAISFQTNAEIQIWHLLFNKK